jgi:tartrate dehydrogenase/decarboxylase/D-malate dehydrogenase
VSDHIGPQRLRVAVIPGDGIGPEVIDATIPVLRHALRLVGARLEIDTYDWGARHHRRVGRPAPVDAVEVAGSYDAILLGAIGAEAPDVIGDRPPISEHQLLWGTVLALRQGLDLAVNVRPLRAFSTVAIPVPEAAEADFVIVRENTEGEYAGIGGRFDAGSPDESAIEVAVHTRRRIERCARYAFDLASRRGGELVHVTKSNVMQHGYGLWDDVVREVASDYLDVAVEVVLVDAMAARMVRDPTGLDVMLTSNLFGDVLSDLGAAIVGGLGLAPSANIDPDRRRPGLYEPVHGTAPDIAGQGIANPVACLLSGAMLLEDTGFPAAAHAVREAVSAAMRDRTTHPPDLGGTATTAAVGEEVMRQMEKQWPD